MPKKKKRKGLGLDRRKYYYSRCAPQASPTVADHGYMSLRDGDGDCELSASIIDHDYTSSPKDLSASVMDHDHTSSPQKDLSAPILDHTSSPEMPKKKKHAFLGRLPKYRRKPRPCDQKSVYRMSSILLKDDRTLKKSKPLCESRSDFDEKSKPLCESRSDLNDLNIALKKEPCASTECHFEQLGETTVSCIKSVCTNSETTSTAVFDHNYAARETILAILDIGHDYPDTEITHISSENHGNAEKQITHTTPENDHGCADTQLPNTTPENDHGYAEKKTPHTIGQENHHDNADKQLPNTTQENHHGNADKQLPNTTPKYRPVVVYKQLPSTTPDKPRDNSDKQITQSTLAKVQGYTTITIKSIHDADGTEIKVPIFSPDEDRIPSLEKLAEEIRYKLPSPYVLFLHDDVIEIIEHHKIKGKTGVKLAINIDRLYRAKIFVHRKEVSSDHYIWTGLPVQYNSYSNISELLTQLQNFSVCIGNPDEGFHDLCPIGCELNDNNKSSVVHGYREGDFCAQLGNLDYHSTIRSSQCSLLVPGRRCNSCGIYRRCLWSRKRRLDDKSHLSADLTHSTYKHKDMTKDMLILKIKQQKTCMLSLQHEVDRLQREIKRVVPVPDNAL